MARDGTGLGAALRTWRDRLPPTAVGLPAGRARRAVGLRREELADLAGISVDYVVRLEQGRARTPSSQVAGALARALRLDDDERDHLYLLAGLLPPGDGLISDHIPPGMQRLLTRLGDAPAAVFAADWRLVWWNHGWASVLGDPSPREPEARSLVRLHFPTPQDGEHTHRPVISANTEGVERAIVADLRSASARFPDDPRLAATLRRTLDGNPRFARLWREGAVGHHTEDRKTILHPTVGPITVTCDLLTDAGTGLKVVVYTADPDSEDASRLALACAAGIVPGP
ncbi:helix-turn-helix domain-containing protein [Nocardiopsis sp. MG754419]|uniref:helix-turn-helix domain-containing protein n=1 Tax=Nocardiopsis sp. MG754419 TaxID=2259865 RepID=UPI001BAA7EC8|nr:helix-turn-helix transcriptional regulator [Nocardiopsis sp. MG754419]